MWQRKQTLYLAVALALLVPLAFGEVFEGTRYIEKLPYAILIFISLACEAVALFAFKRRDIQIRLIAVASVLLAALQVWLMVDYFRFSHSIFQWTSIFPAIAFGFDVLAGIGVYSDELMVREASRIRSARSKAQIKAAREARKNRTR